MSAAMEDLLDQICRGTPDLEGARCRGRAPIFDETDDPELVVYALHQCRGCPALAACESWFHGLKPSARPLGVVAGLVNRPAPVGRSQKAVS